MNLLKLFFQKYKWVLIFALAVALAAGLFTWQKQEKYDVSLSLNISRYGTQTAQDYKYDNYYAVLATDEFGDTVAGWFKTPEMTQSIYKKAQMPISGSLDGLKRRFQAAKISPNLVEIRFSSPSEKEAKILAQAAINAASEKANALNASSWQGISFLVIGSEPVVVENNFVIWWNVLIGFFVGLVLGIFVWISQEYFKQ